MTLHRIIAKPNASQIRFDVAAKLFMKGVEIFGLAIDWIARK